MTSFSEKRLRATFILAGTGSVFPGTNNNTLKLENMKMTARVQGVARLATQAELFVYGMKQADMNALTVAWANPPIVLNHLVIIEADSGKGFSQVFKGTILEAQPDYRAQPEVPFCLTAMAGYFQKINAAEPTSYNEVVDIGVIAGDIIDRMGAPWTYVDGGADGVLENPYFWGSLWDQLAKACQAANADFYVQGDEILIVPAGQPRSTASAVILSPESGLIGYPMFERSGLNVSAIFDPAFACGSPLEIRGNVPAANGRWFPYSIYHELESRTPKGVWQTQMQCLRVLA